MMPRISPLPPTLAFILAAILLPNLVALVAVVMGIGTPIRTSAILGYFVVVLLARRCRPSTALAVLSAVVAYDVINSIALLFSLSFLEIAAALRFATEVRFFASPLYLVLGLSVVATTAATAVLILRHRDQLKSARLAPPLLLLIVVAGLDLWFNDSPHHLFGSAYAHGRPFRSAMIESGFEKQVAASRINVLIIIVEGLGRLADDRRQALVMAPLRDRTLADRYELRLGSTEYYGSTTNAEMRELCASRQPYTALTVAGSGIDCLPARLARRGYGTEAFNAFTGKLFDLESWYPRVGFQRMTFAEQLLPRMRRTCGTVFAGACDLDVATEVAQALRTPGGPRLVYWLTLNTHIPVHPGEGRPRFSCNTSASDFSDPQVC
jgi:hypothetical protein